MHAGDRVQRHLALPLAALRPAASKPLISNTLQPFAFLQNPAPTPYCILIVYLNLRPMHVFPQTARKIHVAKFRAQKVHLLVTTDVAARGIDIPLIDNVINYDFPPKPELFVHRVGRCARAGRSGSAFSILTRDELPYLLDLHLFLSRCVCVCGGGGGAQQVGGWVGLDGGGRSTGGWVGLGAWWGWGEKRPLKQAGCVEGMGAVEGGDHWISGNGGSLDHWIIGNGGGGGGGSLDHW